MNSSGRWDGKRGIRRERNWPSLSQQASDWPVTGGQAAFVTGSALFTGLCWVCLGVTWFGFQIEEGLKRTSFPFLRAATLVPTATACRRDF